MIKILFLAANPKDTDRIRLDEEVRDIQERLRMAILGSQFAVEQEYAVRVKDLQGHLLRHQPKIVHFSGHGSRAGIVLEGPRGHSQAVPPAALKRLFATLKDDIRCVVLNACFTVPQAEAIAESIDCVVGMSGAIDDKAAVSFAASFYQGLGFGRDLQTAFELGCGQTIMEGSADEDTPKLIARGIDPKDVVFGETGTPEFDSLQKTIVPKVPPVEPPKRPNTVLPLEGIPPGRIEPLQGAVFHANVLGFSGLGGNRKVREFLKKQIQRFAELLGKDDPLEVEYRGGQFTLLLGGGEEPADSIKTALTFGMHLQKSIRDQEKKKWIFRG